MNRLALSFVLGFAIMGGIISCSEINRMNLRFEFTENERNDYLRAAARLRGISRTELMRTVVSKVLDDQLILAVLDDADRPRKPMTKWKKQHNNWIW
jgi:hypothetical protein